MSCEFGKLVSENGPIAFDYKFIKLQSTVASVELGDEFIEDNVQIVEFAGDAVSLLGEDYFIRRAKSVVSCSQARYLGNCTISGCLYKKEISEVIDEIKISTLST